MADLRILRNVLSGRYRWIWALIVRHQENGAQEAELPSSDKK